MTGFFLICRRGAPEPPKPPDFRAFTWPARESDRNTPSADLYTDTGQNAALMSHEKRDGGRHVKVI